MSRRCVRENYFKINKYIMFVKRVRFLRDTSQTRLPVLYSPRDVHTHLCNTVCEGYFNLSRKIKKLYMYIENTASGFPLQTALHLYYKPTHVYTHALMTTFIFIFFFFFVTVYLFRFNSIYRFIASEALI